MAKNLNALYLFCIARSESVGELPGTGVDGRHSLSVLRCLPELCAVVSEVALEDFCGPEAEQRMEQLAWIGPCALRHEAVVEEVMRLSPVLPSRFGTLFSSRERLEEVLALHGEAIAHFLDRVADQEEWSVKGFLDRRQALQSFASARLTAEQAQLAALAPGRRYFEEKRIQAEAEKELGRWLYETCHNPPGELREQATDFCECPVHLSALPPEGTSEMVLNWAFLMGKSALAKFRPHIDKLNASPGAAGLVFELSGPWPPYRFVPPLLMGAPP